MSTSLDFAALTKSCSLVEIGQGGEGLVYAISNRPDVVFKEFKKFPGHQPSSGALEEIIELLNLMNPDEKQWLSTRTTWPHQIVTQGNQMCGFLMPIIPSTYFRKHGARISPKKIACEWNYLSMREKFKSNQNIHSEVPQVTAYQALRLVEDLSKTLAVLHKYNIVVGDISGRNLLWTDIPSYQVLIIDIDSVHIEGKVGVSSPKQSPDWDDPFLGVNNNFTTIQSDLYKLSLAAYRAIWAASVDRPDFVNRSVPPCPKDIPEAVRELVIRGLGPSDGRPSAAEWVNSIQNVTRFNGRPVLAVDPTGPASRPPSNSSASSNKNRPMIPMKPTS